MRKITRQAVDALLTHTPLYMSNTQVQLSVTDGDTRMYLHGNLIAKHTSDGKLMVRDAGWQTMTTKERLNGLGAGIYQKDFVWYIGDTAWCDLTDTDGWVAL